MMFFVEFLKIGTFTFGGGLAMIPLLRSIVIANGWLTDGQFADLIAISQSTPGPIAINMATFIGFKEYGVWGAIAASLVIILPAFIMSVVLAGFLHKYRKHPYLIAAFVGLKATVIGLLATSVVQIAMVSLYKGTGGSLFKPWIGIDFKSVILLVGSYLFIKKTQKHPLYYILGFGVLGIFIW